MSKAVKWRGKSLYRLNSALAEAGQNAGALHTVKKALEAALAAAELKAAGELVKLMELDVAPEDLELGLWGCEDSPTGLCIYNKDKDPWKDECLLCGDPAERGDA